MDKLLNGFNDGLHRSSGIGGNKPWIETNILNNMSEKDNKEVIIKFDSKEQAQKFMEFIYESEAEFYWRGYNKVVYDSINQIINIGNE